MPKKIPALRRGVAPSRPERRQIGPIQIAVIGFDDLNFEATSCPAIHDRQARNPTLCDVRAAW